MKERLIIILVFVLVAAVLVGLNAASYTRKDKVPDSELRPNRSTYNPGPTGTQAFYTLLGETGRKVVRWQEPADALNEKRKVAPSTFVVVGELKRAFDEPEITGLLRWVAGGGRLVIIDREPPDDLVTTTANWKIGIEARTALAVLEADPSDAASMTAGTPAAKPVQPSLFTAGVNAIQTSRFASKITLDHFLGDTAKGKQMETPPPAAQGQEASDAAIDSPAFNAPVVHFASAGRNVVVDAPFGEGQIVYLSDPYVTSNGGIGLVDNARLAVNLVNNGDGVIAFDEYHHGFGANNNRFFEFFAGTPVIAIFLQCAVLLGLVFFSQSRRFGRALPDDGPDRLSKLEYVGAMAELQRRTKAFDLAIENIYRDFRRRAARLLGVDSRTVSRAEFASKIADRTGIDSREIEDMLFKCDEIIVGEPTSKREVVHLVGKIRDIEHALGLRKASKI